MLSCLLSAGALFPELLESCPKDSSDRMKTEFIATRARHSARVLDCIETVRLGLVAATDYVKLHADSIRAFLPARYRVLGTDGFGRSDTRAKLRHFFEVNRYWIVAHALRALAEDGAVPGSRVAEAMKKYGLDPEKPNPVTV